MKHFIPTNHSIYVNDHCICMAIILSLWEFALAGACCSEVETAHAKPQFSVFGQCYSKIVRLLVLNHGFAVLWFRMSSLPVAHIEARNLLY